MKYENIIKQFNIEYDYINYTKIICNGKINKTVKVSVNNNNIEKSYLLQSINTYVFNDINILMDNVIKITKHIKKKGKKTLNFVSLKDNLDCYLYIDDDKMFWRMYEYIDAKCIAKVSSCNDAELLGNAIADFNTCLNDFDIASIKCSIPNFHNVLKRCEIFCTSLQTCLSIDNKKIELAKNEIEYLNLKKSNYIVIEQKLLTGELPIRVVHNDPKIGNVLFDLETDMPICMIDLDTVMPGSILFDIGDAIRSGCTEILMDNNGENIQFINIGLYKSFVKGFIDKIGNNITNSEKELIPFSVWLMTVELGMRYLTDYFDGNKYFKVDYEIENLERAKSQIQLAIDIENKLEQMKEVIENKKL